MLINVYIYFCFISPGPTQRWDLVAVYYYGYNLLWFDLDSQANNCLSQQENNGFSAKSQKALQI